MVTLHVYFIKIITNFTEKKVVYHNLNVDIFTVILKAFYMLKKKV